MADEKPTPQTDEEFLRRRRRRSIAIALALAALVVIFYAITVVKLGPEVLVREI
ncbi:hypothetical protein [Pelagibacterium limicola]|uniref:hypothetical protein n=1 Tax=Pelagibacterium limicola TaxID=2791022 RepID=UPI0018AF7FA4|nr:hypothetical protein [Pelagibacterium limicola]